MIRIKRHKTTHKRDARQRKWGLRATETEVSKRRLGVRNTQEPVYSARRVPFERCIFKIDEGTASVLVHEGCGVKTGLQEAEQHPEDIKEGSEDANRSPNPVHLSISTDGVDERDASPSDKRCQVPAGVVLSRAVDRAESEPYTERELAHG